MRDETLTAVASGSTARSRRGRRRLWPAVVVAVCLAGAAGAAPAGIGPVPPPMPGRVMSSPYPHRVGVTTDAAAQADDGSIVVAGRFTASWTDYAAFSESALALGRFGPDGRVDLSFGDKGTTRDDRYRGTVGDVALDDAGRIVVAGFEDWVPVVARYLPGGEPDRTFGNGGIVRGRPEPQGGLMPATLATRVLADGTILVVSTIPQGVLTGEPTRGGLVLTRLGADGRQLSRTTRSAPEWTGDGNWAYGTWAEASIQRDGSVVVVGSVADPAPFRRRCPCPVDSLFLMRRFAPDARVDPAFGTAGRVMTRIGQDVSAADVAVAGDGSIVVVGSAGTNGEMHAALRFRPRGALDISFAAAGVFTLPVEPYSGAQRVAVSADGGVVLAGSPGVTVMRLDRDGNPIRAFGTGGRATLKNPSNTVRAVFANPDGGVRVSATGSSFRLVEFDASGLLASPAEVELPMALGPRGVDAAVALRRGGVVLAGWIDTGRGVAAHVVRADSPSTPRFGARGRVTLSLGTRTEATAVAEWPNGALLAAGTVTSADGDRWFTARLTSKGDRDPGFGANGVVTPLAPARSPTVVSAAALPGARSEILGTSGGTVVLLRLLANGAPDGAFGSGGAVTLPLDSAAGLVVAPSGRSFVGGQAGGVLAAVGVDAAGNPDTPSLAAVNARAAGVALARDGGLVVAGTSTEGIVIARWTADRVLDRAFGSDGIARRGGYDAVGIVVQNDGRLVVAARQRGTGAGCLLRFLYFGDVDASFGTDGVACAPSRVAPAAVAVGPGVLYVAGTAESAQGTDLALTSFEQVPLVEPVARGVAVARISAGGSGRTLIPTATHPVLSPDGRSVAYIGDDDGAPGLFVSAANGGRRRSLTRAPFEDGSVLRGTAPVWSRDGGLLAFETLDADGIPQIAVVGADGRGARTVAPGAAPSWGPRRQLAYLEDGWTRIVNVASGDSRTLGRPGWLPQWSPRGDLILLGSTLVRPDGTVVGEVKLDQASWKPDGSALVGLDGRRIVVVDVARLRSRTVLTGGVDMRSPTWSRDGRWIAYVRYVGVYQLVIVDARTGRRVVAWRTPGRTFAGTIPSWGPAGVYVGVS